MTEEEVRNSWEPRINSELNERFYHLEAYSGYNLRFADPEGTPYLLSPDVNHAELGQAVLSTLKQSRFLPLNVATQFKMSIVEHYKNWVQMLMERYQYKTKRALFKNMKSCSISLKDNVIEMRPTWHEKLEAWSGDRISKDDYVYIPVDSPPEDIGIALRLAFSRCK